VIVEVDGKVTGTRQLDKPVLTIGRLSGNDVQVPSQRVSRMHARIRWERGSWVIEDADSLNGIVFQGNRISQHELRHGDQIALAPQTYLRYEIL
jgi:pSer/pThr/pTyr-binding forkhead associated (FHA) protein